MSEKFPSVLDILAQRIKTGSTPKKRGDPYKVGLVIEGGLMRAVVSAGMLVGLQALGAKEAFDGIYSVSAGSCNGAYFLSDQTSYGTAIYYNLANSKRFINLWRLFKGKPIADLHYVIYGIVKKLRPLQTGKIINSDIPFHVFIASAKDAKVVDITKYKTEEEVLNALYYSCDLPILAGWPHKVTGNTYYTDGGVLIGALPLDPAIKDGCTHLLVLMSSPDHTWRKPRTWMDKVAVRILNRNFPTLAKHYFDRMRNYDRAIREIHKAEEWRLRKPRIEAVHLNKNKEEIRGFEKDKEILRKGALDGFNAVMEKFKGYNLRIDPEVQILE